MSAVPNQGAGYTGQMAPTDWLSKYNAAEFHIRSLLSRMSCATLVQVVATTSTGTVAPPGYVNITPLVNMLDGNGNSVPHGTIYQVPFFRLQGGGNAVIIDPVVGDIGLAVFCDRDISAVVNTKAQANPGSYRMHDMSDGIYLGALLGSAPTQYVVMSASGLKIVSPTAIELDAPDIKLVAPTIELNASTSITATTPTFTVSGNLNVTGTSQAGGKNVGATHTHSGVTTGSGNTGAPV